MADSFKGAKQVRLSVPLPLVAAQPGSLQGNFGRRGGSGMTLPEIQDLSTQNSCYFSLQ